MSLGVEHGMNPGDAIADFSSTAPVLAHPDTSIYTDTRFSEQYGNDKLAPNSFLEQQTMTPNTAALKRVPEQPQAMTQQTVPHSITSAPGGMSNNNFDYGEDQFLGMVDAFDPMPSSSFTDLRDLPPFLQEFFQSSRHPHGISMSGTATPHGFFDFGVNSDYSLDTMDFACLGQYNEQIPFVIDQQEPLQNRNQDEQVSEPANAFGNSVWTFIPQKDNAPNLTGPRLVDSLEKEKEEPTVFVDKRTTAEKLDSTTRDRMLAIMFQVWNGPMCTTQPLKVLPSLQLLDSLLQYFLTSDIARAASWLHIPSVSSMSQIRPELLLTMIAAGAALSPDESLNKLALALQGIVYEYLPTTFIDNTRTRDLQTLQANLLQLELAFWSGNSKKLEIAESFEYPLVTMLRKAGRLQRSTYDYSTPLPTDTDEELTVKHVKWIEQESWKRLVFRLFAHDTSASVSLLRPPIISPAELFLPFPEPQSLWMAQTPQAWRVATEALKPTPAYIPALVNLLGDPSLPIASKHVDQFEIGSILMQGYWRLVHHHREWSVLFGQYSPAGEKDLGGPRYQELARMLESARLRLEDLHMLEGVQGMMLELILLHHNVPLGDVQLFAGLEGVAEAKRVYSTLQSWFNTSRSRQAIWHAGQILRLAEILPQQRVRDFTAVTIYQASLVLWAYGIMLRSQHSDSDTHSEEIPRPHSQQVITLNSPESPEMRRFIALNRGTPSILDYSSTQMISVADVKDCISLSLRIMQDNHKGIVGRVPPLVDNLMDLMKLLGTVY